MKGPKIGILAVQGAFIEHRKMLESLGCDCVELRQKSDICDIDGLVLPGGESTVQGKLLRELDMFDSIKEKIENGLPVLATCAGLILLAEKISNDSNVYFGTLPVTVERNAYGRQLGSFEKSAAFHISENNSFECEMTFIRAPYIKSINKIDTSDVPADTQITSTSTSATDTQNALSSDVHVLAKIDGRIVAAQYHNQIGLAFHPELGEDTRIHEYYLSLINR